MKHWSALRKTAFCLSIIVYGIAALMATRIDDWSLALWCILMLLFIPSLFAIYLMFNINSGKQTMRYETSRCDCADRVPPHPTTEPVPIRPR